MTNAPQSAMREGTTSTMVPCVPTVAIYLYGHSAATIGVDQYGLEKTASRPTAAARLLIRVPGFKEKT